MNWLTISTTMMISMLMMMLSSKNVMNTKKLTNEISMKKSHMKWTW